MLAASSAVYSDCYTNKLYKFRLWPQKLELSVFVHSGKISLRPCCRADSLECVWTGWIMHVIKNLGRQRNRNKIFSFYLSDVKNDQIDTALFRARGIINCIV